MDLIRNNIKAVGIHLLMMIFSIVLVIVCVVLSPIYKSQVVALIIVLISYGTELFLYVRLGSTLKLEENKRNDYLVGILIFIIGIGIWGMTLYYSQCPMTYIAEEMAEYWMLYNLYIAPSWLVLYGHKQPIILLLGSLVPGILLTVGMKIRRYKNRWNKGYDID